MDTGNDNAQQPHSHWTGEKGRNMRAFFESFAKKRNFDPLIADHWYNITRRDIVDAKVLITLLERKKNRLIVINYCIVLMLF